MGAAERLAEAYAEDFEPLAEELRKIMETVLPSSTATATNSAEDCRAKDPSSFRTHGAPSQKSYEDDESKWAKPDKAPPPSEYKTNNKARGDNAAAKVMDKKQDVCGAMVSKKLGPIDFVYGEAGDPQNDYAGGYGFAHIAAKHGDDAARKVSGILAQGKYYPDKTEKGAYTVVLGNDVVSLKQSNKAGGNYYTVTSYSSKEKAADYKRRGGQIENKEGGK